MKGSRVHINKQDKICREIRGNDSYNSEGRVSA